MEGVNLLSHFTIRSYILYIVIILVHRQCIPYYWTSVGSRVKTFNSCQIAKHVALRLLSGLRWRKLWKWSSDVSSLWILSAEEEEHLWKFPDWLARVTQAVYRIHFKQDKRKCYFHLMPGPNIHERIAWRARRIYVVLNDTFQSSMGSLCGGPFSLPYQMHSTPHKPPIVPNETLSDTDRRKPRTARAPSCFGAVSTSGKEAAETLSSRVIGSKFEFHDGGRRRSRPSRCEWPGYEWRQGKGRPVEPIRGYRTMWLDLASKV